MPDIAISLYDMYHLCRHFSESYLCIDMFLYHPCSRFSLSSVSTCVCIIFCTVCVHTSLCHQSAHFSVICVHISLLSVFTLLSVSSASTCVCILCVTCVHSFVCHLCPRLSVLSVFTSFRAICVHIFRVSCVRSIFFVSHVCTFIHIMCPRCFRSPVHIYFLYPHSSKPSSFFVHMYFSLLFVFTFISLGHLCPYFSASVCVYIYSFVLSVATCPCITSIHVCFSACH